MGDGATGGEPNFAPSSETPGGYVGQAAFDYCQPHRMIGQTRVELLGVCSAGGSRERLSVRSYRFGVRIVMAEQQNSPAMMARWQPFAGAAS